MVDLADLILEKIRTFETKKNSGELSINHITDVFDTIIEMDNSFTIDREVLYIEIFLQTAIKKINTISTFGFIDPKDWKIYKQKTMPKLIFIQVKLELLSKHKYVEFRRMVSEAFNSDISRSVLMMLGFNKEKKLL
jgi:hypothetical protein